MDISNIKNDSGIYQIKCLINNNLYIGSSIHLKTRLKKHLYLLKNNKHPNNHLQSIYNLRGKNNLEVSILEYCDKKNILIREQYYIDLLHPKINILTKTIIIPERDFSKNGLHIISETSKKTFKKFKEIGIKSGMLKLNTQNVIEIKKLLYQGYTNKYIAKLYNVTPNNISYIKTGICWKEVKINSLGLIQNERKDTNKAYKYSDSILIELFKEFETQVSNVELSKKYNIHERMIGEYRKGRSRKYIFDLINKENG